MSRKVPVKIGQCSKAMLEGFYGKASYFRSLLLKCCVVKVFILRSTSTVLLTDLQICDQYDVGMQSFLHV